MFEIGSDVLANQPIAASSRIVGTNSPAGFTGCGIRKSTIVQPFHVETRWGNLTLLLAVLAPGSTSLVIEGTACVTTVIVVRFRELREFRDRDWKGHRRCCGIWNRSHDFRDCYYGNWWLRRWIYWCRDWNIVVVIVVWSIVLGDDSDFGTVDESFGPFSRIKLFGVLIRGTDRNSWIPKAYGIYITSNPSVILVVSRGEARVGRKLLF